MSSWAREIATGYAAGQAIGQGVREKLATRKIDKNLPKFAQLDSDYNRALEQGDTELANQIKVERDQYGAEVYRAADKLNALTGGDDGSRYLASVVDSYIVPPAQKQGIMSRVRGAIGMDKPQSYAPPAAGAPAAPAAPAAATPDPKLEQYAALDADLQKALAQGDTPLAEQIKAERDALGINDGYTAIPSRVDAKAVANPYEKSYGQLGFRSRLAEAAGRQVDPAALEEVNSKAAAQLYGAYFAPARDAAVETAKKNGRWSNEQAHQIAGSLKSMAMYIPQYKDAVIQVDESSGGIYIDLTGGESSDAISITRPEDLAQADKLFAQIQQRPSSALPTAIAGQQAEAKRRQDVATEASKKMFDAVATRIVDMGGDAADVNAVKTAASQGYTTTILKPEEADVYKTADTTWQTSVTIPNVGTYLIGKKAVGQNGNLVYTTVVYDTAKGEQVPDTKAWADWVDKQRGGESNAMGVINAYQATRIKSAEEFNRLVSLWNTSMQSAMEGKPLLIQPQDLGGITMSESTAIPPKDGGSGALKGKGGNVRDNVSPEGLPKAVGMIPVKQTRDYVAGILHAYGTPPAGATPREQAEYYINAVEQMESGGTKDPMNAVGPAIKGRTDRAFGPFQIMPETAASPTFAGMKPINLKTASYEEQKEFATTYLEKAFAMFGGDPIKALASYNTGPNRDWLKSLPSFTVTTGAQMAANVGGPPSGQAPAPPPAPVAPKPPAQVASTGSSSSQRAGIPSANARYTVNGREVGPYASMPLSKADGGEIALSPEYFNSIRQE